jgi:hypothetical protein
MVYTNGYCLSKTSKKREGVVHLNDKLYKQVSTHPIHLINMKCKATCNWFAAFAWFVIQFRKEVKVQFD